MSNKSQTLLLDILYHHEFNHKHNWQTKYYKAGNTILKEGNNTANLYFILSGQARVLANIELQNNTSIHPGFSDLGTFDIFGELSFINHCSHSTNIAAVTDCEIAVIQNERLESFLEKHPKLGLGFYKYISTTLSQRLAATNTKAFSLLAWGLDQHGIDKHLE